MGVLLQTITRRVSFSQLSAESDDQWQLNTQATPQGPATTGISTPQSIHMSLSSSENLKAFLFNFWGVMSYVTTVAYVSGRI